MAQTFEELSKQRLDFSTGPRGETIATLTITFPDGSVHRYSESTDDEEIDQIASAIAAAEVQQSEIAGVSMSEEDIAGLFGSIGKAFKKVGKIARKVVTSKVFRAAAKGLQMAAPALGPYAPAAMAISGGMNVASKLGQATYTAEAGAKRASRMLGMSARRHAQKASPRGWSQLMSYGNRKRKNAMRYANRGGYRRPSRYRRRPVRRYRRIIRRRPVRRAPWVRRFVQPRFRQLPW